MCLKDTFARSLNLEHTCGISACQLLVRLYYSLVVTSHYCTNTEVEMWNELRAYFPFYIYPSVILRIITIAARSDIF